MTMKEYKMPNITIDLQSFANSDGTQAYVDAGITESNPKQFAGYHGTSFDRAELIAEEGFNDDGKNPVCFAPMNDLGFAQRHGRERARQYGDTKYGVVMASFPPQELIFGMGGDQIDVPAAQVGRISVVRTLMYEMLPDGREVQIPQITEPNQE